MANTVEVLMNKLVEKMSDGRPDQLAEVVSMQKSLKMAMLKKNFKDHPAMALFISTLQKRERAYGILLQNKRDLTELQRQAFFEKRDELRLILSFFNVESLIETVEKELNYQLSDEVSPLSPAEN